MLTGLTIGIRDDVFIIIIHGDALIISKHVYYNVFQFHSMSGRGGKTSEYPLLVLLVYSSTKYHYILLTVCM